MKKIFLVLSIIMTFFACSEEDLVKPFGPDDTVPPAPVSNVTYTPIPGGAIFKYTLPTDKDLAYVKAIYYVNGIQKDAVASQYERELLLEGLPDNNEYEVALYAIDKRENYSEPTNIKIIPDESPVKVMRESLICKADFGGFRIQYKNPSKAELSIYLQQKDSVSDRMLFYQARVFTQAEGEYQIVGLPNKTNKFEVFVRDRFGNTSESLIFEDRPWREEYLDKKLFKYVGKPQVYDKDDWFSWMGRPENFWDDIVGAWNFAQTAGNGSFPHYFCIDLGTTVPIGRILFQQRLGDSEIFNANCIKHFDVYGIDKLPAKVNNDDPLENWIKLNAETFEVKRPSGRKPGEPLTSEDHEAAEKGIMFTIDTPFPRPEIRYIRFKFIDNFTGTDMALLGELSFWAQWK